jgi:hypothetical protein
MLRKAGVRVSASTGKLVVAEIIAALREGALRRRRVTAQTRNARQPQWIDP